MDKIELIAFGLALATAFGAGWKGRGWLAGKDRADMEAAADRQAQAAYATEAAANKKALADLEEINKRQAAESAAMAAKLKEVYANDPEARVWADYPLPDSIRLR